MFNIIDKMRLPFKKDRELFSALYNILGFYPHNIEYYKIALTHRSVGAKNYKGKPLNNERLEFLGDAILGAVVGDIVFRHFQNKREGFLTNTRSKLVQRSTLGKLAVEMGIDKLIKNISHSHSHNSYMAGNAFEALIGAVYLDRGYHACMKLVKKRILNKIVNIDNVAAQEVNFKSKLIEWAQKNKVEFEYVLVRESKDEFGSPFFKYKVVLENIEAGLGSGYSKKESQQKASADAYNRILRENSLKNNILTARDNRLGEVNN